MNDTINAIQSFYSKLTKMDDEIEKLKAEVKRLKVALYKSTQETIRKSSEAAREDDDRRDAALKEYREKECERMLKIDAF